MEIDAIDKKRGDVFSPSHVSTATLRHSPARDRAARRAMLDRLLRVLPKRFGFRDARSFLQAFIRANELATSINRARRRLTPTEIRELERRVLNNERPGHIARVIGCAEQTVLNRATQLRKRLAETAELDGSGV